MVRLSFFLIFSFVFLSCGGESPVPESNMESTPFVIGLAISMTESTPFFASLVDGAVESADLHNISLITVYADEDPVLQSRQIIELADQGIDLLLLNPVNDSVAEAVDQICTRGVPVMTIDRGLHSECVRSHIASDNRSGGLMAGEYLSEALYRTGNVVEIKGTEGSSAATERGLGFREAVSAYPDIEIAVSFDGEFSRELAEEEFRRVLQDTRVDGVFAHNDDMILGAISAAEAAGYTDILFVGFDAIDEAVSAVESGRLMATVAQRPGEMGHLGVETALDLLQGLEVPDSITVDLALILR